MVTAIIAGFAFAAAAGALVVILSRNILNAMMALLAVLLCLAAIYALLGAFLVAAIQALVYAGAVMVLFIFAIMVLDARREDKPGWPMFKLEGLGATMAGVSVLAALTVATRGLGGVAGERAAAPNAEAVVRVLLTDYVVPLELTGLLLFTTLVAVSVLAGKGRKA